MKDNVIDNIFLEDKKSCGKRKHVTLTIQQKLEIINLVEKKVSRQAIATMFGIGKSTVHDIHKRRDQIRGFAEMHNSTDISKRRRVDQKTNLVSNHQPVIDKEESRVNGGEEELIDSIDGFEYQEISDQEYEIVYDTSFAVVKEEAVVEEPKVEPSPKSKRASKTLTFREKYHVIQLVESGASVPSVCESYGIGRTTVYDYMKRKQEITDFVEKSNDLHRKTFKKSKFPEVEEQVLDWCEARETFMKQQFYECAKAAFEDARDHGSITSPSGFCGSWSWAKRFFHRHPELKKKLVTANGDPLDPSELSMVNSEYLDETVPDEKSRAVGVLVGRKYLTMVQRHEVLNEIDAGQSVQTIADKYEVSKTQIYDIFKRRHEFRDSKLNKLDPKRKMIKRPRYPQVELELLRWCLQQTNFPLSNVLIADKAICLFETMGLSGYFNPSSSWAKKFVLRHPELSEKQGLIADDVAPQDATTESFLNDFHKEDREDREEEEEEEEEAEEEEDEEEEEEVVDEEEEVCETETFVFMDSGDMTPEYQEEYIVEELELESTEEDGQALVKDENLESQEIILNIDKTSANALTLIPDQIALKSLKILIKYSAQQGHERMMSQLVEYQNKLHDCTSPNLL